VKGRRVADAALGLLLLLVSGAAAWTYAAHGLYGFHVVWRRGGSIWPRVGADDPRLTEAARLSLHGAHPVGGPFVWTQRAPGFETAELPLTVEGREIDAILLARIDPLRWAFTVHNRPAGDLDVDGWARKLGAALIVNGSYYDQRGVADTPFRSGGVALGPASYESRHGAFVASREKTEVVDLASESWRAAFGSAPDALVSYPLLLDQKGETRARPSDWLANRSFVAQDLQGRILIGTTRDASLRLSDLARVLKVSAMDLRIALNLDGGPVACQRIELRGYRRRTCGTMEIQANGDDIRLLQPVFGSWDWALPVVIAVTAKR
jgi:hypothetical protein